MAWKLTVATVDKTNTVHLPASVNIDLLLNERSRFNCTFLNYLPARLAEVVAYAQDGTTPIFGGLIVSRSLSGLHDRVADYRVRVECGDFGTYADGCYISLEYVATVKLKAVLQAIITNALGAYGITLASMADGPDLDPFKWSTLRVSDALRELVTRTGYNLRFSPTKEMSMVAPGGLTAPETITDADMHVTALSWTDPSELPATKIRLQCGPSSGQYYHSETVTADGVTQHWHFSVKPSAEWGPGPWTALYNGTVHCTIGAEFLWDWTTGTLSLGTHAPLSNGDTIALAYYVNYPFEVISDSLATPVVEYLAAAESALTYTQGKEIADALLVTKSASPRDVSASSQVLGWLPGQTATIDSSWRQFDNTALITSVSITLVTGTFWVHSIRATEGTSPSDNHLQQWRNITSGSSSSTGVTVSGGGGSGGGYLHVHLGGSRNVPFTSSSYVRVELGQTFTCSVAGSYTFRTEAITKNAGTSVQVCLYDLTAAAMVAGSETTASTSVVWSSCEASSTVALVASHKYEARVKGSNTSYGVYCGQATLELVS